MSDAKPVPLAEARNLMPRNAFNTACEKLNEKIKAAAERDQYSVRIDWLCTIKGDNCSLTPLGEKVVNAFEHEGYRRLDIYECRQFVDVGMALSWEPKDD